MRGAFPLLFSNLFSFKILELDCADPYANVPTQVPDKFKIKPDDAEDVKQRKKKQAHSIKSKMRFAKQAKEQDSKKSNWQDFLKVSSSQREERQREREREREREKCMYVSVTGQGIQKKKRILDFDEEREHFQVPRFSGGKSWGCWVWKENDDLY